MDEKQDNQIQPVISANKLSTIPFHTHNGTDSPRVDSKDLKNSNDTGNWKLDKVFTLNNESTTTSYLLPNLNSNQQIDKIMFEIDIYSTVSSEIRMKIDNNSGANYNYIGRDYASSNPQFFKLTGVTYFGLYNTNGAVSYSGTVIVNAKPLNGNILVKTDSQLQINVTTPAGCMFSGDFTYSNNINQINLLPQSNITGTIKVYIK